jgi:hypothetical protein
MLEDQKDRAGLEGIVGKEYVNSEISRWAFKHHEAYRLACEKGRWADKTPDYVGLFDQLMALAPDEAQTVVIFRDPFDVAYSIVDRGWNLAPSSGDVFEDTLSYVAESMSDLIRISEQSRSYSLKYEDLATDSERVLRSLCNFLGEAWDDRMLNPWDQQQNFGTEDPIARGTRRFQISRNNWQALSARQKDRFDDVLGNIRKNLGY